MTFQFTRPEGGELGLEDAIGQVMREACLRGYNEAGAHPDLGEALLLEVLTQQRRINAAHDEELKTWKTRLNDETADLRQRLEDRRNRVKNMIYLHWGEVDIPQGDVAVLAMLEGLIGRLLEERNGSREKFQTADGNLDRLHDHIVDHFPKFGDREPVDAAIEILTIFHTHGPALVKFAWENAIRPALHVLAGMGIDVLPPGTIVYGAKPSDKPHKPE